MLGRLEQVLRDRAQQGACVLILLPTYNGVRFLSAQIDSILRQAFENWVLLIRDDGSSDQTLQRLDELTHAYPEKIFILENREHRNLGARGSFEVLMATAAEITTFAANKEIYFAFSDQDDVWESDKLLVQVQEMEGLVAEKAGIPALVHSDLSLIDDDGSQIASSMALYQGLNTSNFTLSSQVLSNSVTGCTALINRALLVSSLPISEHAVMHDWWISLVASALGVRSYMPVPTVQYRQHAQNTIGAKEKEEVVQFGGYFQRLWGHPHDAFFVMISNQAMAFRYHFTKKISIRKKLQLNLVSLLTIRIPPFQKLVYAFIVRFL